MYRMWIFKKNVSDKLYSKRAQAIYTASCFSHSFQFNKLNCFFQCFNSHNFRIRRFDWKFVHIFAVILFGWDRDIRFPGATGPKPEPEPGIRYIPRLAVGVPRASECGRLTKIREERGNHSPLQKRCIQIYTLKFDTTWTQDPKTRLQYRAGREAGVEPPLQSFRVSLWVRQCIWPTSYAWINLKPGVMPTAIPCTIISE